MHKTSLSPRRSLISGLLAVATATMLAACGGGSDSADTSAGGGQSLTATTPFSGISGLGKAAWSTDAPSVSGTSTSYTRVWSNSAYNSAMLIYQRDSSSGLETLSFSVSASSTYIMGKTGSFPMCKLSGTNSVIATCSTWGVVFNRTAGTVAFTATPITDNTSNGTMSGTLSFTPF